ncbi:S8 family serine peptidase [Bacillus suaedaesalsae]|uniref:S8 family serine peptidase n=1 Tax=Bacillus suaedaesalsae TaxID=2810349 RepID=A0ABS2DNP8_9BACI|nr:S8 family serine peptidase [Bacillus suaedaesalsae]MBM6619183.1 S8 family serine peptidase [Bacillus suaedaesalsae]
MKKLTSIVLALLMVVSLAFSATPKAVDASVGVVVDDLLEKALSTKEGPYEVIVTFKADGAPTSNQLNLLEKLGIKTGVTLKSLPMVGIVATQSHIEQLRNSDEVLSIYLNKKLEFVNDVSTQVTGVDKVRTDDSMRKQNGGLPVTGKGIGVVVNDSGVDGTHKDLEYGRNLVQNVLGSTNLASITEGLVPVSYTEGVVNTDTNSGHGTHVAGSVGGTGAMSAGKHEGVAPGADLIGYGSGGALLVLDGIGGFDYAITHQAEYNIRVITNSWGSSGDFDPYNPINIASKAAYDRGITVLFAAGNEGPGENTHNPYAKAPWVISVAAGEKDGTLADFSSRGTKGVGGTFTMDGKEWTWEDRPTVTAPGVDIISTKTLSPLTLLAAQTDAEMIETAYLPYYTVMSGTSMATPHTAGIVALLLEANPQLSPDEIKQILQDTATNMPGYESWEVGAGYVNAYAAVDKAFSNKNYGETVNINQEFTSNVESETVRNDFSVEYNPLTLLSQNAYTFTVEEGVASLVAKVNGEGLIGEGNPINLVLVAPDGTEYSSGVSLLFALYYDRTVSVTSPMPGTWKAEIRGLKGAAENPVAIATPEVVEGTLAFTKVSGFTGLNDLKSHPAAEAIKAAVSERLVDGYSNGSFKPDAKLKRSELAQYLVMGAEIRQALPASPTFSDVSTEDAAFVEAVTAKGAAFRDQKNIFKGVMLPKANGTFAPNESVTRMELAYSLVQALGLQNEAADVTGELTVQYGDTRLKIEDEQNIPDELKGYVQLALDLNILNAYFNVTQGPYDLKPTVHATFAPTKEVTRGDYAVAVTRYYNAYLK